MSLAGFVRDTLYPDCSCWLCHRDAMLGADHLCAACRNTLRVCMSPAAPQPLDGLSAGILYEEPAKGALHALKYGRQLHFARFFVHYMSVPDAWQIDCMVPVPLHPLKHWMRGFNQSEELCLALKEEVPLQVRCDLLRRTRFTMTQTRLDPKARERNVRDAFRADAAAGGLSILLVDDVTTTHATLVACATALKRAGAKHVYAVCACYAGR